MIAVSALATYVIAKRHDDRFDMNNDDGVRTQYADSYVPLD